MTFSKIKWEKLHETCGKDPYQSLEWAQINESLGSKPKFIFIEDKDNNYSSGLLYFEEEKNFFGLKRKRLTAEGFPLFTTKESADRLLKEFKKRSYKSLFAYIKPLNAERSNIFKKAKMVPDMYHTIIIDLTKPLEILWKETEKKSARWGVKKSRKEGIKIEKVNNKEDLLEFYKTYKETAKAGEFDPLPFEFFNKFYELMHGSLGYILVAKKDNTVIGGSLLVNSNKYMRLRIQASSRNHMHNQPSSALYWAAIEFAKEKGFQYFDLGGYGKYAAKDSKSGKVSRFKKGFGGEVVECPTYYYGQLYIGIKKIKNYFRRR
jgi:lipid II:glycine glycyltransferase (peptidoglycan interpeptide bridge formation enzyme)